MSRMLALLQARYGGDDAPAVGPCNDVIELMLAHRSVRDYSPDALPEGTLETLVAAAQSAATSSNMQSWSVVAVTDKALKDRLAEAAEDQRYVRQCPLFLCFIADLSRAQRIADDNGLTLGALPTLESFVVAATDCALAAQNAALAAESLGLATCMIGALRNHPERVSHELGLPDGAVGIFGLCVGYADPARLTDIKPRLSQRVVLHRERYDHSDESAYLRRYDETLRHFGQNQKRSSKGWAQRVQDRLGDVTDLHGREKFRDALVKLGFGLL
jgi:nitroreductase